jgi:hypothetical protein
MTKNMNLNQIEVAMYDFAIARGFTSTLSKDELVKFQYLRDCANADLSKLKLEVQEYETPTEHHRNHHTRLSNELHSDIYCDR